MRAVDCLARRPQDDGHCTAGARSCRCSCGRGHACCAVQSCAGLRSAAAGTPGWVTRTPPVASPQPLDAAGVLM